MKCPRCAIQMEMTERHGIEIVSCPACNGIWMEREEIEKLLELEKAQPDGAAFPISHDHVSATPEGMHHGHLHRPKHKSWLAALFE